MTAADPRVRAGLERRGIASPEQVLIEPWGIGTFTAEEEAGRRVMWTLLFYRERPDDNPYAKPIHGLTAIVDLDDMAVLRVEDQGVVPLSRLVTAPMPPTGPGLCETASSRWRSSSPTARASRSTAGRSAGSAGGSGWASPPGRPSPAHHRIRRPGQGTAGHLACLGRRVVHPVR